MLHGGTAPLGFVAALLLGVLATAACGESDRCLDQGGHWNDSVGACEFASGPLNSPGDAIGAAKRTLAFAYGPDVLQQEPFLAELADGVWHVYGTLPRGASADVAEAWIEVESGHIRAIAHGRSGG